MPRLPPLPEPRVPPGPARPPVQPSRELTGKRTSTHEPPSQKYGAPAGTRSSHTHQRSAPRTPCVRPRAAASNHTAVSARHAFTLRRPRTAAPRRPERRGASTPEKALGPTDIATIASRHRAANRDKASPATHRSAGQNRRQTAPPEPSDGASSVTDFQSAAVRQAFRADRRAFSPGRGLAGRSDRTSGSRIPSDMCNRKSSAPTKASQKHGPREAATASRTPAQTTSRRSRRGALRCGFVVSRFRAEVPSGRTPAGPRRITRLSHSHHQLGAPSRTRRP